MVKLQLGNKSLYSQGGEYTNQIKLIMNDQLPDKTVLLIILSTLLLVFFLVFSFKSNKLEQEKSIQWMDSSLNSEFVSPV